MPVLVAQGFKWSSCKATLMDVHTSDQLGDGCYQQNNDRFKPWRPAANIQRVWRGEVPPFPHPSWRHFSALLEPGGVEDGRVVVARVVWDDQVRDGVDVAEAAEQVLAEDGDVTLGRHLVREVEVELARLKVLWPTIIGTLKKQRETISNLNLIDKWTNSKWSTAKSMNFQGQGKINLLIEVCIINQFLSSLIIGLSKALLKVTLTPD